ncbi:MAG: MSMEG_0565 family glycosyltransferase [Acetobacter orientalis]
MRLSVSILTHSTNPRGGVVHGMALAEALHDAGHDVTLIAPDDTGKGFFRTPRCASLCIPAVPELDLPTLVERRIDEIKEALRGRFFDVLHAQDPISSNALADLQEEGQITAFARTVHHLDSFTNPLLAARQERGFTAATCLLSVSAVWEKHLHEHYGLKAPVVGNGVDPVRFTALPTIQDATLRARYHLPSGKRLILAVGGVERRKNTVQLLDAFIGLRQQGADLQLVVVGGASLLDHSSYRTLFDTRLKESGQSEHVTLTGPVAEDDMPAFYRQAAVLAYPSSAEGFGLCPLEALACGTPVIVPDMPPFTEHFARDDVLWCQSGHTDTLLLALHDALTPQSQERFRVNGPATASRFTWQAVAARHLPVYRHLAAFSPAIASNEEVSTHA